MPWSRRCCRLRSKAVAAERLDERWSEAGARIREAAASASLRFCSPPSPPAIFWALDVVAHLVGRRVLLADRGMGSARRLDRVGEGRLLWGLPAVRKFPATCFLDSFAEGREFGPLVNLAPPFTPPPPCHKLKGAWRVTTSDESRPDPAGARSGARLIQAPASIWTPSTFHSASIIIYTYFFFFS